jgi:hypothetical protein
MICQGCHQAMPFRLADGSPYFEAPELLVEAPAELAENHLALCPTCCAKWHHARDISDSEVLKALLVANALEITVRSAGKDTVIRFVQREQRTEAEHDARPGPLWELGNHRLPVDPGRERQEPRLIAYSSLAAWSRGSARPAWARSYNNFGNLFKDQIAFHLCAMTADLATP